MIKLLCCIFLLGASVMAADKTVYEFTLNSIDGQTAPLSAYKGKVVMLVNVASRCGFTPQYSALETVYEKYKDRGFVIVGIPAQQFRRAGAGIKSGNQNILHHQVSRQFSDDVESFGEGRRQRPAVSIPDGQIRESANWRRHQMEFHEVSDRPGRPSHYSL